MAIKMVPDIGAPLLVTAIDLTVESTAPEYTKWVTGAMAVGGYVAAYMNWGGDFVKNMAIAALPAAAKNTYDWAKGGMTSKATRKVAFHRSGVTRYPAPASEAPFTGNKLT